MVSGDPQAAPKEDFYQDVIDLLGEMSADDRKTMESGGAIGEKLQPSSAGKQ
jgi:hypothetical protein